MTSRSFAERLALLALALALLAPLACRADILDFASFRLRAGPAPQSYELEVRLPGGAPRDSAIELPDGCRLDSAERGTFAAQTLLSYAFRCPQGLPADAVIRAPWGSDGGVYVSELRPGAAQSRMLHGGSGGVALPVGQALPRQRPLRELALEYTGQGVLHILEGFDHLAFVLCLCLLAWASPPPADGLRCASAARPVRRGRAHPRRRELLLLVTAFTLGHSISLALSYLGVIAIPVPPTEAVIALSIAFMAREAIVAARAPATAANAAAIRPRYLAVVVAFGLLHGLGFASALGELGIGPEERIAGLVFFNVGVEIGQLLFVAVAALAMRVLRWLRVERPARTALLGLAGGVGAFWTVERVAGFLL